MAVVLAPLADANAVAAAPAVVLPPPHERRAAAGRRGVAREQRPHAGHERVRGAACGHERPGSRLRT